MDELCIIIPKSSSTDFRNEIKKITGDLKAVSFLENYENQDLTNKKILFALELDECGFSFEMFHLLISLTKKGKKSLNNTCAAIIIKSPNDLYTKSTAQQIILLTNSLGCTYMGHPVVECISDYKNFLTWQKRLKMNLNEIYFLQSKKLIDRLLAFEPVKITQPKILALHSSSHSTSNTLGLWNMVKNYLPIDFIKEFHVEDGTIVDCKGCSYKTCSHYSKKNECFYGGIITKELLPAIDASDIIIWLCPNYNDAVSAKLMAVLNRLTVLYKKTSFNHKRFYSIIVSGNSGSDCVAKQLIGALNINKGFILPPYFLLHAIANDPLAINSVDNIKTKALTFADTITDLI